ncbi:hypothetical protein RB653_007061 [Dictyostelium firmibasis]|uniref:non-specific serine/threonine protein kinase n=1 Tax=Dictyostelium firmibasis TaxID=79012 RepID=A0AAN7YNP4_9MYCE
MGPKKGKKPQPKNHNNHNNNNNNNNNIKEYIYSQDTRILLFKVILAQNEEIICMIIQIAYGLPGLPKISDISRDLGILILKLPNRTIRELELFLESKNIYFREEQQHPNYLNEIPQPTTTTTSPPLIIQQQSSENDSTATATATATEPTTTTTTTTTTPTTNTTSTDSISTDSTTTSKTNILNFPFSNQNKSKQKRPISKEESFDKILRYNFDLGKIFDEFTKEVLLDDLKNVNLRDNNNSNNISVSSSPIISPVFQEYDLFLMDSFIILCGNLDNVKLTLDEFKDYYKEFNLLDQYIEEFRDNLIDDFLVTVEIIASWYIPQRDYSIVKFINCFGEMLDSTIIESFSYIFNKTIKKEDDWSNSFIQAALSSNEEFKRQVMCLNDELIQDRYDQSLYSIMHPIKFDNVREFILIYSRDENYFKPQEFWYLVCKYDAVAITQHIINKNIAEEDLSKRSGKPYSSSENPLEINPLSLLSICSTNFSHKIASILFQFYDFKESMPITPTLKGVFKPPHPEKDKDNKDEKDNSNNNINVSNGSSNNSGISSSGSQFQYFRVLNSNCYFNDVVKKRAPIFIDLMTQWNIYLNTEIGEGSDENVDIQESIYSFQNSTEYLSINSNTIHKLRKSSISLLSKVLEFNDRDTLISLLRNWTQGGCTLCKDLIDEKQLLITISRPQYFQSIQLLHQNGYTIIPKYQLRDPYIFFAGSKQILQFLLEIHSNCLSETIDIRHWIQAIMSAGQYSSETEFFQYYPKIQELSLRDKYSRTLNILELQYILGHIEGIEFLLENYLGFTKPYHLDNQELLEVFDVTFVQKKDIRTEESLKAEKDLLEQEENEKKRLKEKRKKEEKEKKKQQLLKQKSLTPTKKDSTITTPTPTQTTTPTTTPSTPKTHSTPINSDKHPPTPTTPTTPTPTTTPTKTPTTTTSKIPTVLELSKYDISIGKFKFSRKDEFIIGRGSNGTLVFKGIWNDRIPVAIKQMHKAFNPLISKEIEVLIRLTNKNCNNIVRYIDQEEDDMFVYLGLTLCNGSLQDLVEKDFETINNNNNNNSKLKNFISSELRLLELIKDIVYGIQFLHQQGIVHNDLNPRNILIKDDRFIISDLGLSKMEVTSSYSFTMHAPTGQEGFHPAEVLLEKRKTKSVDIFSMGCILFYLMTNGQHPFGDKFFRMANILTDKPNLEALKHNLIACDLISQMISKNESDRPTTENILLHPFFWNHEKKVKFIDASLNLFKDSNGSFTSKLNKLINQFQDTDGVASTPFLSKPWNQLIDPTLIEHITNKQNQLNNSNSNNNNNNNNNLSLSGKKFYFYDYSQVKDLVRCIRNTIQHHKEIQRLISQSNGNNKQEVLDCLESQETVLSYFEEKVPDLLLFLYQKFKKHLDSKSLIYFNDLIIK